MKFSIRGRLPLVAAGVAVLMAGGVGIATAASHYDRPPSNANTTSRGIPEFGMTESFFQGHKVDFTYTKGYYCDTSVSSTASTNCEAGANFKKPPAKHFDPLYIEVPLGFKAPTMRMQCPTGKVCVDHPGTIDLRRIEPALKPLYPKLTDAQLTAALANFAVPGHQHFITDANNNKPEWWPVKIVGVTNQAEYNKINRHESAAFLLKEAKAGRTTPVIPTNLFLYFGVK